MVESGDWERAGIIIDKLIHAKPWDKQLLFVKANLIKSLWIDSDCKNDLILKEAVKHFSKCSLLTGLPEAGINTATLLLLTGRKNDAIIKADETARQCEKLIIEKDDLDEFIFYAIIAEVNLIQERFTAAETLYRRASAQTDKLPKENITNIKLLLKHHAPKSDVIQRIKKAAGIQ